MVFKKRGTSLAVQWLRLHASTSGGAGLIPGRGTRIPHAAQSGQKKKKKLEDIYFFNIFVKKKETKKKFKKI